MVVRTEGYQSQIYDTVEGPKPGMRIRSRGSYRFNTFKVETACVMGERAGGVREGFHPRFKVGCVRIEPDTVEKMSSGPRDPRLGDEGTRSKRSWFTNQMVRDEVEDLGWESGRHRGPVASSVSHGPLFHDLGLGNRIQAKFHFLLVVYGNIRYEVLKATHVVGIQKPEITEYSGYMHVRPIAASANDIFVPIADNAQATPTTPLPVSSGSNLCITTPKPSPPPISSYLNTGRIERVVHSHNQQVVKVLPFRTSRFVDRPNKGGGQGSGGKADGDLPKVFRCGSLQSCVDPLGFQRVHLKLHILERFSFGEVKRWRIPRHG